MTDSSLVGVVSMPTGDDLEWAIANGYLRTADTCEPANQRDIRPGDSA